MGGSLNLRTPQGRGSGCLRPATVIFLLLIVAGAPRTSHAASQDRVITYVAEIWTSGGGRYEWRTFDPVRRKDELFRSFERGVRGICWDSTESYAEYVESGTLYRVEWEEEAQPWPMVLLPGVPDLQEAWFNPDSQFWQASTVGGVARNQARGGPHYSACRSELWQSDREGEQWRIAQAETTDCGGCWFCTEWTIPNPAAVRHGAPISLGRLGARMAVDSLGAELIAIPPPRGESAVPYDWYLLPFRSAPGQGLALRIRQHPGIREKTPFAPFYLMNRSRGAERLLETPGLGRDENASELGLVERDGFLLVYSRDATHWTAATRNYVFDLSTGEQIFHPPKSRGITVVWVKRPRPARVDVAGLRRLRERFR